MTTISAKHTVTFGEYSRFLKRYLSSRVRPAIILGVCLFSGIGLQIVNPLIMRNFIDSARAGGNLIQLRNLALLFIGIAVLHQLIGVLTVYITENLGWATTNELRFDLAKYCLGLDMSFHTAHTPGEMIERLDGDVMALSNFFSQFILQVFGNGLLVVGVLIVLSLENWLVGLTLGIFVVITLVILLSLANIAVPSWEKERQASANLYGFLEERLSGTEDIRSNNAMHYVLDRFYRLTRDLMKKNLLAGIRWSVLMNTTWVLFGVGNSLALVVCAYLFNTQVITLGTVFMIVYYTNMISWPLERITQQFQDLQRAGASLVRILSIQRIQGKIPGEENFDQPARSIFPPGALTVVFDNVTFGYSDSVASIPQNGKQDAITSISSSEQAEKERVLCNISFRLEAGKVLGVLGRTGSGKTTLTRLLFRLYDPDQGRICLGSDSDPQNISQVSPQELRRRVGMVTQNIQLFHATVRENLTFFDSSIPDEKILEAIHDLGLQVWYKALAKGLDTELESGGGGLSAGEAQLLAFTRIFLRNPGLVILDEATSRLDPATEHLIEQAVDKLAQARTAIIVAHRLATVQRADNILILDDGNVVEYGDRIQLMNDPNSRFGHLLATGMEEVLI